MTTRTSVNRELYRSLTSPEFFQKLKEQSSGHSQRHLSEGGPDLEDVSTSHGSFYDSRYDGGGVLSSKKSESITGTIDTYTFAPQVDLQSPIHQLKRVDIERKTTTTISRTVKTECEERSGFTFYSPGYRRGSNPFSMADEMVTDWKTGKLMRRDDFEKEGRIADYHMSFDDEYPYQCRRVTDADKFIGQTVKAQFHFEVEDPNSGSTSTCSLQITDSFRDGLILSCDPTSLQGLTTEQSVFGIRQFLGLDNTELEDVVEQAKQEVPKGIFDHDIGSEAAVEQARRQEAEELELERRRERTLEQKRREEEQKLK